jgi:hypothetical protein
LYNRDVPDRLARLSPRAILLAGFAVFAVYAYPGYQSWDSMTQLAQARRGVYSDDHPPAMAVLWHVLEVFVHGPLLMWLLSAVLFTAGVYHLLATRLTARAAAVATVAMLWFPPIGTVIAAIYKDTTMAAFLVAAVPLLVARRNVIGLVLVGAATAMRWNAIAATLPIVVLLYQHADFTRVRRYATAIAAWLVVTAATMALNGVLADEPKHYWYKTQALMDIADTVANARDYSDAELADELAGVELTVHDHVQDALRRIYKPVDFRHLDRGDTQIFVPPETPAGRAAVARAWQRVIADNPGAYLRYRWDNFVMLLRLDGAVYDNAPITNMLRFHEEANFLGFDLEPGRLQLALREGNRLISRTTLFDPYWYALLGVVLLWLARRDRVVAALLLSGLAYEAAWLVLAPTADYRYSHWMVTCTVLGGALWWADRVRKRAAASRPSGSGS